VAARGGSSPALALAGVPGHQTDHKLVQNDAGTLAHVTGGSTGAIVPHRWPAPEGGGAATPGARGHAAMHEEKGNWAGDIAHSSRE
jgi:hypothetical protein